MLGASWYKQHVAGLDRASWLASHHESSTARCNDINLVFGMGLLLVNTDGLVQFDFQRSMPQHTGKTCRVTMRIVKRLAVVFQGLGRFCD